MRYKHLIFPIFICIGALALIFANISYYGPVESLDWADISSDLPMMLLAFVWLFMFSTTHNNKRIYWPLMIGSFIAVLGVADDLANEFAQNTFNFYSFGFESLIGLGMILIAIGLYRWINELSKSSELKKLNKQLRAAKAEALSAKRKVERKENELEKQNKKLEEALDDLYSARISTAEEIEKGIYTDVNNKIKEKIKSIRKQQSKKQKK